MRRTRLLAGFVAALTMYSSAAFANAQQPPAIAAAAQATGATGAPANASLKLDELDVVVREAMRRWSVPGVAVAVIVDGRVVLRQGYGYRHAESRLPVTAETLFPIASLTKPFTAALFARMVADGVIDWDRPVVDYLPDFRLRGDDLTAAVTVRDMLSHQSGLPPHDFVWYGTDLAPEDLFRKLQFLEPSQPVRGGWQYQNLMFMAAGHLAGEIAGSNWATLVDDLVLRPLEMHATTLSLKDLKERANIALPYADGAAGVRRVPFRSMDAVGAAGSMNANVDELASFLQMMLHDGSYNGVEVLPAAAVEQILTPQVALPDAIIDASLGASDYGLGMVLSRYGDARLAHHEGGVDGFISLMAMMPDRKAGVVVLTNYSGENPVPWVVARSVFDQVLGAEPTDWVAYYRDNPQRAPVGDVRDVPVVGGSLGSWRAGIHRPMLADFAGSYAHPAYGNVDIILGDRSLTMRFHGIDVPLRAAGRNRYIVASGPLSGLGLTFFGNALQRIDRVAIPWEPTVSDIVFVRRNTGDNHDDESSD